MLSRIKSKNIVTLLLAIVFVLCFFATTAFAADEGMNFVISPLIPDNQVSSGAGYFDIMVKPDSTQVLSVLVKNKTAKEMVLEVEAVTASTTPNGEINYTTPGIKDESLTYAFSEIASLKESTITVPANSEYTLEVTLAIPKGQFDGMILGGIKVKDVTARLERENKSETQAEIAEGEAGVVIYNEYQSVIGVVIRETETVIEPDFELIDVVSGNVNYRAAVTATIKNPQPDVVKAAIFTSEILPKGQDEPIFSVENKEIEFAPNSVMNYEFVDQAGYGILPGDYFFKGSIEYKGEIWEFEKEFTITKEKATEVNNASLNQQTVRQVSNGIPLWAVIAIVLGIILLILLVVLIMKMKKKKSNDETDR